MTEAYQRSPAVLRHKTAIRRPGFSVPIQCLLRDGLLYERQTLFDYGCGRGQDLDLLRQIGVPCSGWDPVHRPAETRASADIVNLGYVINVIEDPLERSHVLQQAWSLCHNLLIVSALAPTSATTPSRASAFGDGLLTSRGTFQKCYSHQELRAYLEQQLPVDAVPAAPNVFYLFRSEDVRQEFLARRYRRQVVLPRQRASDVLFEANRDVLDPLIVAISTLGRLPGPEELPESQELILRFGSLKRAFQVVRVVTGTEPWREVTRRRAEDLFVYLALARFGRRAPLSKLPLSLQRDVKAFAGSYQQACEQADHLLFSVGDAGAIDAAAQSAPFGHLVDNALLVDRDGLGELPSILRTYEGCARALLGEVDEANVVKLHRHSGKVTYLAYRDFHTDPNPALALRIKVDLRTLTIDFFDYSNWPEPPRLDIPPSRLRPTLVT